MDDVKRLADLIYSYPTETVTKVGCEGLAQFLTDRGVSFTPAAPGHNDQYNIAEMAYKNGYEKVFADGKRELEKRGRWIIKHSGKGRNATNWAECSECRVCGNPQWKVCPVCKTRMDVVQTNDFDPDDFLGEYEEENT